jgi:hypothetical protein
MVFVYLLTVDRSRRRCKTRCLYGISAADVSVPVPEVPKYSSRYVESSSEEEDPHVVVRRAPSPVQTHTETRMLNPDEEIVVRKKSSVSRRAL